MCGRFTITVDLEDLRAYLGETFDIEGTLSKEIVVPRYNVAPGQKVIAVIHDGKNYRVGMLQWGFIPKFAKDEKISYSMINAKSETLADKPAYRDAYKHQRCIILADGFYEWLKEHDKKLPMRFIMKDESIFPMAGLWSTYQKEDGTKLHTTTIVTTEANALVGQIHTRMPVILDSEGLAVWLDPKIKDPSLLQPVFKPYDHQKMTAYHVTSRVNQSSFEDPSCIEPIEKKNSPTLFSI